MTDSNSVDKIQAEYHKKLKEVEAKLAAKHKELNKIEQRIRHETKKIYDANHPSSTASLKAKRAELNVSILKLKKDIKKINKEKIKRLKKL